MKPHFFAATLALVTGLAAPAAAQFCPSHTLSSVNNDNDCGVEAVNGNDPTVAEYNQIFDLVARGPEAWGDAGPTVGDIGQGCGNPEPLIEVTARFPCELLKAIAQAESGWRQFCVPTTPADQVGGPSRTIISFDCGYGISQVTSGMHIGETPNFDRERVASDPTYNLATGTRILAGKWRATQCVGDNQPRVLEHWYIATWAYNGLAYSNNPNNPNYDPGRGVYDPQLGGSRPYQEKVFGRIEFTQGQWDPTSLAYPNPGDIGDGSAPPALPDPSCASPTDCTQTRPLHETVCQDEGGTGAAGGGGAVGSTTTIVGVGGAPAGVGVGGRDGAETAPIEEHCSCRWAGRPDGRSGWLMALGALSWLRRRRRSRRR